MSKTVELEFGGEFALWYYDNVMTKASKILLPYEKKWVALNAKRDRVLASANDVKTLAEKLRRMKIARGQAVMTWVFPFDSSFSPFNG